MRTRRGRWARAGSTGRGRSWRRPPPPRLPTVLPGFLSGFGILANYTYTDSRATVPGRSDNPRLLRTTPNEFNLGLTYDRGPFSARAAVTYNDAYIFDY
ncbi:MAG: hypothetical protein DMF82_18300, partial [Acidobacteria bacterium]